jgi:hypothetical protein
MELWILNIIAGDSEGGRTSYRDRNEAKEPNRVRDRSQSASRWRTERILVTEAVLLTGTVEGRRSPFGKVSYVEHAAVSHVAA